MKQSIKYVLIFVACALLVFVLMEHRILSGDAEYDDAPVPIEEQYSADEIDVYNAAFSACRKDINNVHPGEEDGVVLFTCLCTAKRVLRAYINADNPLFKDNTYDASRDKCYAITVKHFS